MNSSPTNEHPRSTPRLCPRVEPAIAGCLNQANSDAGTRSAGDHRRNRRNSSRTPSTHEIRGTNHFSDKRDVMTDLLAASPTAYTTADRARRSAITPVAAATRGHTRMTMNNTDLSARPYDARPIQALARTPTCDVYAHSRRLAESRPKRLRPLPVRHNDPIRLILGDVGLCPGAASIADGGRARIRRSAWPAPRPLGGVTRQLRSARGRHLGHRTCRQRCSVAEGARRRHYGCVIPTPPGWAFCAPNLARRAHHYAIGRAQVSRSAPIDRTWTCIIRAPRWGEVRIGRVSRWQTPRLVHGPDARDAFGATARVAPMQVGSASTRS